MDDDIVARLREHDCFDYPSCGDITDEAADEVEHLQADRDKWRKIADSLYLCGKCDWCREKYEKAVGDE